MALTGPDGETVTHIDRRHGAQRQPSPAEIASTGASPVRRRLPDKGTWVGPPDVGQPVPEKSKRYLEELAEKAAGLAGASNALPFLPEDVSWMDANRVDWARRAAVRGLSDLIALRQFRPEEQRILAMALGIVGVLK